MSEKETRKPDFGPWDKEPAVKTFRELSQASFELYHERYTAHLQKKGSPVDHLFCRMLYTAESTSFGIRLLTGWGQFLPALALGRVRLEQLIVCSYLIHERDEVALKPFVHFIPIGEYKFVSTAVANARIAAKLPGKVDLASLKLAAVDAQKKLRERFDPESDRFQREWTQLNLSDMVRRRDELTRGNETVSRDGLEAYYVSLYKAANPVIHSDCIALSPRYLSVLSVAETEAVLMGVPEWGPLVAGFLAHFDIVQCSEVLERLGTPVHEEAKELLIKWDLAIAEYT